MESYLDMYVEHPGSWGQEFRAILGWLCQCEGCAVA